MSRKKRENSNELQQSKSDGPTGFFGLVLSGLDALANHAHDALNRPKPSPEEKLLKEVRERRKGIRKHVATYGLVNGFLLMVNVLTWSDGGGEFWWPYPAGGWGIGLGLHVLSHRWWLADHRAEIEAARETLGLAAGNLSPEPTPRAISLPTTQDGHTADIEPAWADLMSRVRIVADQARTELQRLGDRGAESLRALDEGQQNADRLFAGAHRLGRTLRALAPRGAADLEERIRALDERTQQTSDARLQRSYESNLRLLRALLDKVRAIEADRERMRVVIDGFVLSAQHLQADAARLATTGAAAEGLTGMRDTAARLAEEVDILREVEEELEAM